MQRITAAAKQISVSNLSRRLPEAEGKDEIAMLAQTFNSVFEQLETAFISQKRFIAHASHELRTPLTILEGEVSVALQKTRTEEEYRQTLETMQRTVLRLHRLTTNLLTLSRLESAQSDLPMSNEFFDEMLHHSIADVRTRFPQREFEIHDEQLQQREVIINCNRELLETAFTNIIENAVKYSNRDTTVQISVVIIGEVCTLIVRDEGLGISSDELQHIFTPFYRAERTRSLKGTGVGLALVKAIINLHSGTVLIESQPDKGTTVKVHLSTIV
jgi:signal transduction histidine kinase